MPDVSALARWVAEHRGMTADLMTYRINQSLGPQLPAGITFPCAGGKFLKDRILSCLIGVTGDKAVDEIGVKTGPVIEDACALIGQKRVPGVHYRRRTHSGLSIRPMMMKTNGTMRSPGYTIR